MHCQCWGNSSLTHESSFFFFFFFPLRREGRGEPQPPPCCSLYGHLSKQSISSAISVHFTYLGIFRRLLVLGLFWCCLLTFAASWHHLKALWIFLGIADTSMSEIHLPMFCCLQKPLTREDETMKRKQNE